MRTAIATALRFITNIPNFVMLYIRFLLDREAPLYARIILGAALLYVVSPIDLIPGAALPVIGWLEDLLIFYIAIKLFLAACPQHIVDRHVASVDFLDRLRRRGRFH